ncbi:MAG: ABC transporter substrate-binding protein [Planctomycetes bacterium]|nr:ABC transporter substrate-binding protein [Planctomycetota bacterium]
MLGRILVVCVLALVSTVPVAAVETVTLQLPYYHQFQFAGYYAAEREGYFAEEDLAVTISEFQSGIDPTAVVLSGQSDFGIVNGDLWSAWAAGQDLFLVAVIFQRSPFVLLVREDSPYRTLADIVEVPKARLVGPTNSTGQELLLGLKALGVDPQTFWPRRKQPEDIERFARGELDVLPGYVTNEPFALDRMRVSTRPLTLHPRRTMFPGDALVCHGEVWRAHPDIVERFRRACLRGWAFAVAHPESMVDHILAERRSANERHDRQSLLAEARAITALIEPDLTPIGTINRERLDAVAVLLREQGMPAAVLDKQIYRATHFADRWLLILAGVLAATALGFVLLALVTRDQHRSLAESQAHYRNLVELAQGYFAFRLRIDGTRMYPELASPSIERILGHPIEYYQHDDARFFVQLPQLARKALLAAARRTIADGSPLRMRLSLRHPQGGIRRLVVHALPNATKHGLTIDGICLDLTAESDAEHERRRLQESLQQAQRNESLGLLASGVAHDFNNLLGAIRGYGELLRPEVSDAQGTTRWERLMMTVDRAAGLVRQILAYSGKGLGETKAVDLGKDITQLVTLLTHGLPANVRIELHVEPDLPPAVLDPVQFQQVVLNLVVNAAESYEGAPGTVRVTLDRLGARLRLAVSDSGCGMDEATKARMFEPYFTTKRQGHGLGLAAVQGIVKKAGGDLTCRSAKGQGTEFTLLITPTDQPQSATGRYRTPTHLPADAAEILVVDDDELMREATGAMLEGLHYRVHTLASGLESIELLRAAPHRFAAVVVDCRMPELDGPTLVRRLREAELRIPALLVSGMMPDDALDGVLQLPRTRFLAKPYTKVQLQQALVGLFGDGASDGASDFSTVSEYIRQRKLPS